MKVYIKPWEEALKSAKEFGKRLVDAVDGMEYIIGISRQYGDWGHIVEAEHIVEAKKDISGTFDRYTTYYNGTESFSYPACCVEEITPDWLEEHASKFGEEVIATNSTVDTWDKNLENYETHRITIYKAVDGMHAYFFYVKRVSYNGCEETVEDFREIN